MSSTEDRLGTIGPPRSGVSAPISTIEKLRRLLGGGGGNNPPPPPPPVDEGEDDGMMRMSFLEHLQELRSRIIKAIIGIAVAAAVSVTFTDPLWNFVKRPAVGALKALGYAPTLVQLSPMETINIIWFKLPLVCSLFIGSPWVLYQVWAFISPGLYRRERRWAVPFILTSAGLFIAGGMFGYFVAFPFAITFLLGMGKGKDIVPYCSVNEYFEMFVNVILGVGLVFELPIIIFFLTLLRLASPGFLLRHSRYAILIIFIIAAVVTPTPDIFNMMIFALPMCMLFYVGIFAAYLLVLRRESRKFPWRIGLIVIGAILLLIAGVIYLAITKYGYRTVPHWPFVSH